MTFMILLLRLIKYPGRAAILNFFFATTQKLLPQLFAFILRNLTSFLRLIHVPSIRCVRRGSSKLELSEDLVSEKVKIQIDASSMWEEKILD